MHTKPSLRPFQARFLAAIRRPEIDTAALSIPRGNGKSWLAGQIIALALNPRSTMFRAGTESVLCAASIEQARIVFRFAREELNDHPDYKFLDSANRISITHKPTETRLRIIGSNGRTAMGLVNCPWAICDEPGSWEKIGGELVWDALTTAQGKPNSPLKIVLIGTLAPAMSGWWHDLIADGSNGTTYVQALYGNPEKWDDWNEIKRCNPLSFDPNFRKKLLEERDEARKDTRLKARFCSYRLNIPSQDEAKTLLTTDDWKRVMRRPVPERDRRPIVGIDLGGGWAWSSAVGLWMNGRTEAIAICAGIPDVEAQEKRDRVPAGTYQKLVETGALRVAEGLRVPPPKMLIKFALEKFGAPEFVIADRFKAKDLKDAIGSIRLVTRVTRWSEATFDIGALRKFAKDGPLACEHESRLLLTYSLSVAMVKNDDQGGTRLVKADPSNNSARDDVAAALTLAAGALRRKEQGSGRSGWRYGVAA